MLAGSGKQWVYTGGGGGGTQGIHAEVIVYIFDHLHSALCTEENMLDMKWLQAAEELLKLFSSLGVIFKEILSLKNAQILSYVQDWTLMRFKLSSW